MEIKKYNASVMDDIFSHDFIKQVDSLYIEFDHQNGFHYGLNDYDSNRVWFPKTAEDCKKPFFCMDNTPEVKSKMKEILSAFLFQSFDFKFKVIVDG